MSDVNNKGFSNQEDENEEDDNIIVLSDEEGNDVEFEYLDSVELKDTTYVVMLPLQDEEGNVVIMQVEETEDEEEGDTLLPVSDPEILDAVYAQFKQNNADLYDFED